MPSGLVGWKEVEVGNVASEIAMRNAEVYMHRTWLCDAD